MLILTEPSIMDVKASLGATQLMKRNYERSGKEWGQDKIERSESFDDDFQAITPAIMWYSYHREFGQTIVKLLMENKWGLMVL